MPNQFALGLSEQEERDLRRRRAYYANLPEGKLAPDVAKSVASGARSGVESALGLGDISTLQQDAMRWLGDKIGVDPEMLATAAKWTSPMSLMPTSEDVSAASDQLFGRDAITRHTPETELGEQFRGGTEFLSGLVDPIPGPSLAALPAGVAASKKLAKGGREALAEAAPPGIVKRPAQEQSGVFDYSARYPPRDLGVERFRPKKVPERTVDLLARPDVRDKMMAGVEAGRPVADWYETGPLRKSFEDQFGPEEGLPRFDQFIDAVAATSPRSDVGTNVRNASYYYGQAQPFPGQNSIPSIEDLPPKNPAPYGHLAQNLHRMNAAKTVFPGGEGLDFKANAKPIAFAANLKGDPSVATVDTHAFRAPAMLGADPRFLERSFLNEKGAVPRNIQEEVAAGTVPMEEALQRGAFWSSKPLPTEYAAFEDMYKGLGQEAGLTPAETQAASWVGHGPTTGLESAPKSFMDFIEERVLLTAKRLGKDPREVWRDAMTGKSPLLSLGAVGLGAGALLPDREGGQS